MGVSPMSRPCTPTLHQHAPKKALKARFYTTPSPIIEAKLA